MVLPPEITMDMMIVFGFLIFVTLLFVFEVVRVDMVGLLMMVLLPLSGVIEPAQAISGLSSNAVVSIIAVIMAVLVFFFAFSFSCHLPGLMPAR